MPFTGKEFEALTAERLALAKLVESYGFELTEQFIGYQFKEDFTTKAYDPKWVLGKDKNWLKQSDVVISDFTSPSIGTDCELVLAKEVFDKKVYAVVPQAKRIHPWLRFYCEKFYDSVEDALKQIKKDFPNGITPKPVDKRQYDAIAGEYRLIEETPAQKYIYDSTLRSLLKKYDAKGKRVVVLHCASGYRARMAKEEGAEEVLGIDLSFREIRLAEDIEVGSPQGIHYLNGDVYSSDFISLLPERFVNKVDIVIGFFLLDHAMNKNELKIVTENIHALLSSGGVFIGMSDHPKACIPSPAKYGVVLSFDEKNPEASEGYPRRVSVYQNGKEVTHFHNFVWNNETISGALADAGMADITIEDSTVAGEGIKDLGNDFWSEYAKCPDQITIEARKLK